MPKLPQHISERFDKEFGVLMVDEGPDAGFEYFTHFPNVESIKSFIATILKEERTRVIEKIQNMALETVGNSAKTQDQIINLIKEDE